tara:strand:- start:144 stop:470 length:327 start_codon:yes stop_codon:yes gene_type:complete
MLWTSTDNIYLSRLRTLTAGDLAGFILDNTNKVSASITIGSGAFLKLQQESSMDIYHYTGSISGDYGGEGIIIDDGSSPFEVGNLMDALHRMDNSIDGELAGSVNNLL